MLTWLDHDLGLVTYLTNKVLVKPYFAQNVPSFWRHAGNVSKVSNWSLLGELIRFQHRRTGHKRH